MARADGIFIPAYVLGGEERTAERRCMASPVKLQNSQFSRKENRRAYNSSVEKSMPNGPRQNADALLEQPKDRASNSPFVRSMA